MEGSELRMECLRLAVMRGGKNPIDEARKMVEFVSPSGGLVPRQQVAPSAGMANPLSHVSQTFGQN